MGVNPYPSQFERSATISSIVATHSPKDGATLESEQPGVTTAGRILGLRSFGKANFLVLSDGLSRLQVYVRADSLDARSFEIFKRLDLGDQIGVEGRVFRTKTNELTIWASRLEFLAKCLVPLPEKWHGLTDVEVRYRQRYLDLIVNPDSRQVFETRARVVAGIRQFLNHRGFLEVETPMMQPLAGGALARPFVTHHNALDMQLFLRIAPSCTEAADRRQVRTCHRLTVTRNEGFRPSTTRVTIRVLRGMDYQHLMQLTEEMLTTIAKDVLGSLDAPFGERTVVCGAVPAPVAASRAAEPPPRTAAAPRADSGVRPP